MNKTFTRLLLSFLLLSGILLQGASAQTITIGSVDPGPYGQGSTITVPFHVNDAAGCIAQNNVFSLYISDASGNFSSSTAINTINNFYGTFFNYTIPNGTPAGTGYRFYIQSSNPAITSASSNTFTIDGNPGVVASAVSSSIGNVAYPEVYGVCVGKNASQGTTVYPFSNQSTPGTTVTASFFNELTQITEVSGASLATPYNFNANAANYSVTVRAVNGSGDVGTYSYKLLNNQLQSAIGSSGNPSACLTGGGATISYNIDYQSALGIEFNYPGSYYSVSWGDGTAASVYTICQIIAAGGKVTHTYKTASCGLTPNGQANSFEVDLQVKNIYCGRVGSTSTAYAKVFLSPSNDFTGPLASCTGNTVTFANTSNPGPDPNATTSSCSDNPNALWTWSVDGTVVKINYTKDQPFTYQFLTAGSHTVTIHLQNGSGPCSPEDYTSTICIQDPPKPNFNIAITQYCLSGGSVNVTPVNSSVIDANCNPNNVYTWTVTNTDGTPASVSYGGGTNVNSAQPQFVFSNVGVYIISLSITTQSCGSVAAPQNVTITVNNTPTAVLSPDFSLCGVGQTLNFNANTASKTYTQLTGTAETLANTYTWTVTGGNYNYAGGTNQNSEYPQITFLDNITYTITVLQQNNCGSVTSAPQHITVELAPTVVAGSDMTICQGSVAALNGSITGTTTSYQWVGGTGTFSAGRNSLQTNYTPSAAEISAGSVTLILTAMTNLAPPCNLITSQITITIIPTDVITSPASETLCSNQPVNYTITASNPLSTYSWTAAVTSGSASGANNGSGNNIADILVNNNIGVTAIVTYTIIPVSNGCAGTPFNLVVTIPATPTLTVMPTNGNICTNQPANLTFTTNQPSATYTWTSTVTTGSISGNTNQATPISATDIQDILINNNPVASTVQYVITPYNSTGCVGSPVTVSVTVQPQPITANAGPNATLCNATSYVLQGNNPSPGQGLWTDVSGSGAVFADPTQYNTTVSGLVGGNVYNFQWAISTGPGCQSVNSVVITNNLPTGPGTTSTPSPAMVCAGSNSGEIDLAGQVGTIISWEQSVDNGTTWTTIVNATNTQTFLNLTQTTSYRAVVQNGNCTIGRSTITTITVNQPVIQANAGPDQSLCNVTTATLSGNDPGTAQGIWQQTAGPQVVFADATKFQTQITGLQPGSTYTFTWTIKGLPPCGDSQSTVIITDNVDVVASFTEDKKTGCGDLNVQFTNQSTNVASGSFIWDFGDGSAQSTLVNPSHTFPQQNNGEDITYTVTLSVLNNCNARPPVTDQITVRPAVPLARILPNQTTACGNFTLIAQNVSPGNNVSYDFYLYLGSALIQHIAKTDKSDATFNPLSTNASTEFTLYMVATGFCGQTGETTHIPITITPPTFVPQTFETNNTTKGCAPFTATFTNNSSGGDVFYYNIYDANHQLIDRPLAGIADFNYTFTTPGTFYVTITASNSCGAVESNPPIEIDVFPLPAPDFSADNTSGCKDLIVNFTNLTPDPNSILSYEWDFGDNSAHVFAKTPPPHSFHYTNSPYTVTLTATNTGTSCTNSIVKSGYIIVNSPPATAFTEKPDSVINIPDYHFSFIDQTAGGAVSWNWTFSDGQTSTSQNPEITFADTGYYKVTLTTTNQLGCDSTVSHIVRITGVPGQLYLPNAFIPSSGTSDLKVFMAKGSGIKQWHLQIFNDYGQLIWETTKLDSKGAPIDGWDGTFKGTPVQQGVYVWQASATFINGTQWKGNSYNGSLPKRTGPVTLIR